MAASAQILILYDPQTRGCLIEVNAGYGVLICAGNGYRSAVILAHLF